MPTRNSEPSNSEQYLGAIARIYHANRAVGSGVLVAEGYVLTCAHVVAAALGVDSKVDNKPEGSLELDFPQDAANCREVARRLRAEVFTWFPEGRTVGGEDMAILRLLDLPPATVQPIPTQKSPDFQENARLKIYGFPGGDSKGRWAEVRLIGRVENGWMQIESCSEFLIEPGFSGAPV